MMDDPDQTQLSSDSSNKKKRSASRPQPPSDQAAVSQTQATFLADQATGPLVPGAQNSLVAPPAGFPSGQQTQIAPASRSQSGRSKPRAPVQPPQPPQPPQPILFTERESDVLLAIPVAPESVRRQRLGRTRRWLRSRAGRVIIPLLTLLIGLAAGLASVIWYGLSGEGPLVTVVPAAHGNLVVDADQAFVSQLVRNNLLKAGLPGKVENITVTLKHGAQMIIQGDDTYSMLFVNVTKHFTVDVQPYVQTCVLQVRVTHADLAGIPVTTFVQTFQNSINQQLAKKPAGLPSDFTYCTVGVSTEPGGMYITYQAVPISQ